ncbi:S-adenosyl-L-methionine-dependent methyltransferase [Roridomyces roridus]|uniref:S-adenosyl-L-methionine-dependent methyltransferase n=1 Tax=Roridomyces roridus TaxID=1738132 RepID=A0AAD7BX64_9AGAR|nr:S-adenosyl-L-methionine-dependent methyltransferase [Roridomyces roridus]
MYTMNPPASIHHTPRVYHEYPGSQYLLPADDLERQRLLLQHNTLLGLFGNRLLLAPVNLDKNDKVLESGTGPGFWLMDLTRSLNASVPMVGVDIDSRLFPVPPPDNIEFRVESVTKLPADWTDTFSLVNQRLLILGLQIHEWPMALNEIYRVLRPGGWVQLAEYAPWRVVGQPCQEKCKELYHRVLEARNLYYGCTDGMPRMLEQAGFVDVQKESQMQLIGTSHGEAGAAASQGILGAFKGMKTPVLQAGGYGVVASEAEYDVLLEGLEKEWELGPGLKQDFVIFWAKKLVPPS